MNKQTHLFLCPEIFNKTNKNKLIKNKNFY